MWPTLILHLSTLISLHINSYVNQSPLSAQHPTKRQLIIRGKLVSPRHQFCFCLSTAVLQLQTAPCIISLTISVFSDFCQKSSSPALELLAPLNPPWRLSLYTPDRWSTALGEWWFPQSSCSTSSSSEHLPNLTLRLRKAGKPKQPAPSGLYSGDSVYKKYPHFPSKARDFR